MSDFSLFVHVMAKTLILTGIGPAVVIACSIEIFMRHNKTPLAERPEVCRLQRRAHSRPEPDQLTASRNAETRREARRAFTSELGQREVATPAGIAAPAGEKTSPKECAA